MARRKLKNFVESTPRPIISARARGRRAFSVDANKEDVERQLLAVSPSTYGTTKPEIIKDLGSTFIQTTFNGINLLLGVGVLSLPYAFKMTGWVVGVGLLLLLSLITNYTGKLIGKIIGRFPLVKNFPDIGEAALGRWGRVVIAVVFYMELASACSMYLILMADNLHKLFPAFSKSFMCVVSALLVMPTTWTHHLAWLSYFSIIGVIASMFLLVVLILVGSGESAGVGAPGSYLHPQPTVLYTPPENWPLCVGVVMVGFAGHAVFPNLYSEMKDNRGYAPALNLTYGVAVVMYAAIASLGYLMYGAATRQEVTLNLMDTQQSWLPVFATSLIVINPFTKFALTLHPVSSAVEELVFPGGIHSFSESVQSVVLRSGLSSLVTLIALSVPHFARLLSFVGAFCSFTVSGWFPCLCYVILFRHELSWRSLIGNAALTALCLALGAGGTIAAFFAPE